MASPTEHQLSVNKAARVARHRGRLVAHLPVVLRQNLLPLARAGSDPGYRLCIHSGPAVLGEAIRKD